MEVFASHAGNIGRRPQVDPRFRSFVGRQREMFSDANTERNQSAGLIAVPAIRLDGGNIRPTFVSSHAEGSRTASKHLRYLAPRRKPSSGRIATIPTFWT